MVTDVFFIRTCLCVLKFKHMVRTSKTSERMVMDDIPPCRKTQKRYKWFLKIRRKTHSLIFSLWMFVVAGSGLQSMLTLSVCDSPYGDGIILGAQSGWVIASSSLSTGSSSKSRYHSFLMLQLPDRAPSSASSLTFKVVNSDLYCPVAHLLMVSPRNQKVQTPMALPSPPA